MIGLVEYSADQIMQFDKSAIQKEITRLEGKINIMNTLNILGILRDMHPNLSVLDEYRKKMQTYLARTADLNEITARRDELRCHLETIKKNRFDEFMAGFTCISQKLKEMYQVYILLLLCLNR